MKVRLAHTVYWGGPCHGRVIWDPWPFDNVPRAGESVYVGDDDGEGAESFRIKDVMWVMGDEPEVELRTDGENGEDAEHAAERLTWLRSIGFDFGPLYVWERETTQA